MKKKIIISSIMTIVLCLSIIAGSTFALFTSEDSVNIAITAGKVKLEAFVKEGFTYSTIFNGYTSNERFENGGDATWAEKALTINRMAPGDRIDFTIKMTNTSDIDIQYRVAWTFATDGDYKLNEKLVVTGETEWAEWKVAQGQEKTTDVSVTLPTEVGNDYQEAKGKIIFTVYAVQWNGLIDADDLDAALEKAVPGTVLTLAPVDFGVINLDGALEGVTIDASNATNIDKIVIGSNADLDDVTIKNAEFVYEGDADCGIVLDPNAKVENLVIENCTVSGTGAKAGRGLSGFNNNATVVIRNCTFENLGYPVYAWGGYKSLTIEDCVFKNIKSWAVMPQSGFDGDLTVNNCQFIDCVGGLVKAGTLTAGHTFTFTNNEIVNNTVSGDHNWFQFNATAGSVVVTGNTFDGNAWTPGTVDGSDGLRVNG